MFVRPLGGGVLWLSQPNVRVVSYQWDAITCDIAAESTLHPLTIRRCLQRSSGVGINWLSAERQSVLSHYMHFHLNGPVLLPHPPTRGSHCHSHIMPHCASLPLTVCLWNLVITRTAIMLFAALPISKLLHRQPSPIWVCDIYLPLL